MLLEISSDFDSHDKKGNTPLVYAAAYGCLESVMILLRAGANPLKDQHLSLLHHALMWEQWNVIIEVFEYFRVYGDYSHEFLQGELNHLITSPWGSRKSQPERLKTLLKLGADKHVKINEAGPREKWTLLHASYNKASATALFEAGFEHVDHLDSKGFTPLMRFIRTREYGVAEEILTQGCNVNLRNAQGKSALHTAYNNLGYCSPYEAWDPFQTSIDFAFIAKLLQNNAEIWNPDTYRCACSPGGCPPFLQLPRAQVIDYSANFNESAYIWVLEWILMVEELRGEADAHQILQYFNRVREFDLAGMTHVCCRNIHTQRLKSFSNKEYLDGEEIDRILEEEKGHASDLDEKMKQNIANQDQDSVKENWLGILVDFYIPDKITVQKHFYLPGETTMQVSPLM
ncbi:hypothetical protein N7520_006732 [Penicillium odoratum]|uniref:uncharacterized protein n=1 Tax=Penicillium odoratum TaxID=1167516 RepID=UPI002547FBA3|nr:uncharacterized protein N7520_006732 [Penicillium odoratum]KAJ5759576.1 hypothetical protein N7520_006732 [Penicillium odoratum]